MKTKKLKINKRNLAILIGVIVLLVGIIISVVVLSGKDSSSNDNKTTPGKNAEESKLKTVDINSKTRPFAVMINNLSTARPYHTGFQDAYMVYEIIVEGGITRYMALFKDTYPEVVGSVRSSRHYYLDYALENDAYYVHWGWSPQAEADIKTLGVNNINGLTNGKPYFFRKDLPISSEHRGFANLQEMVKLVNDKGYRSSTNKPLLLKYSVDDIDISSNKDVKDASKVDLKYSSSFVSNYVYDAETKVYKQFVNNKEHTDYETKKQYTVKNIITYQVANETIDGGGKGRQEIDNIGSGKGYFITLGKAVPITWEKKSRTEQTVYRYMDGTEITVNDGNTWIHIVPESGNISIS